MPESALLITTVLNRLGDLFLTQQLQEDSLTNHEIIHSITPNVGQYIWHNPAIIVYSFDKKMAQNIISDPFKTDRLMPINSQMKAYLLSLMNQLTQHLPITFQEANYPIIPPPEANYLLIGLTPEIVDAHGVTYTCGTIGGTPDGRAIVRSILLSNKLFNDDILMHRVFLHELLHAFGLNHPPSILINNAHPTLMSPRYVDACVLACHNSDNPENCTELSTITDIDKTAIQLQYNRTVNPAFSSPYDNSLVPVLINKILTEASAYAFKTGFNVYLRTLGQHYFVPLLLQKTNINNLTATVLKTMMNMMIDAFFWPCTSIISAHVMMGIMKIFIQKFSKILPAYLQEKDLAFATTALITLFTDAPLKALLFSPIQFFSAGCAEKLAHQTIRQFPKLKDEKSRACSSNTFYGGSLFKGDSKGDSRKGYLSQSGLRKRNRNLGVV